MQNNKLLPISIITLALSITLGSVYMGISMQKLSNIKEEKVSIDSNVMTTNQVADYLGMTEEEVLGIIKTEKSVLESSGSYSGIMFPYFTLNEKLYFYKEQIDEWMREVSSQHKEYDTKKGYVF